MKTIFVVATVLFSLASTYPAMSVYAACPSPAPKCASSSSATLKGLVGAFGCSNGAADSSGTDEVGILLVNFDGAGHFTNKSAHNGDSASGNTYQDFSTETGTYCVNSDGTGYSFPGTGNGGCPSAIVIDSAKSEIRTVNTQENLAKSAICKKQ